MNTRIVYPLLRPTAHAIRWLPLALGGALGLALVLVPEALTAKLTPAQLADLIRIAAICVAVGAAFLLDDPAARSTPAVPTSRLARNAVRIAIAAPAIALWWAATLLLCRTVARHPMVPRIPAAALTLEAAALVTAALALAAAAQHRTSDAGIVAAPGVLVLAAGAWFLPRPVALVLAPGDPHWTASHRRWAVVLGIAVVLVVLAGHERTARRNSSR